MKKLIFSFLILLTSLLINAQVAINKDGSAPDASAMLHIKSSSEGIIIPRTDTTKINNTHSGSIATGLVIYQVTDNTFYYYDGGKWAKLISEKHLVFERNGSTIRQTGHYDTDDFIIGRDALPQNGESVSDTLFFFDKSKDALRMGNLTGSKNWSPDSIGFASVAFGHNTKAKGIYATAWGNSVSVTGNYSTAWGNSASVTGNYATAWGYGTEASEFLSSAWGYYTDATGEYSTAWGNTTYATGGFSTAWGKRTKAPSGFETAFGRYTTDYTPNSSTSWDDGDRLLVIGNGTSTSNRHNAVTLLKNGDFILNSDSVPPNGQSVTDTLLFFDRSKGALRIGKLFNSPDWSPDSIGFASFAAGRNTKAIGDYSVALGYDTYASAGYSAAWGFKSKATGSHATAFGNSSLASGISSTAWGYHTDASGNYSTSWGSLSSASGNYATAWGRNVDAPSGYETAIGMYTADYTPNSATGWDDADRLFVIGNGSSSSDRHNALTMYKNGDFILNSDSLPPNGQNITDTLLFFDKSKAAFRTGWLNTSTNWSPDSTGFGSVAFGNTTKAKGSFSLAWGGFTNATGEYASAWGNATTSSGVFSCAWGNNTLASGDCSTAWGFSTKAPSKYETALGRYTADYTPNSPIGWDDGDRLFVIGNGTSTTPNNALTLLKNGDFILNDDTVPANGEEFTGNLLFFDRSQLALRMGKLSGSTNWSPDSIGFGSVAFGLDTKAIGNYSTAMGDYTTASGMYSLAYGWATTASGSMSAAWGIHTKAPSGYETAFGTFTTDYTPHSKSNWDNRDRLFSVGNGTSDSKRNNAITLLKSGDFILNGDTVPANGENATDTLLFFDKSQVALRMGHLDASPNWSPDSAGLASVAFGRNTKAKGDYSLAWGNESYATGNSSSAWGYSAQASATYSTAWGVWANASGSRSTAWGSFTTAPSYIETALGSYNTTYTPNSTTVWDDDDRLFVIGNGSSGSRHNALTLMKNGKLGLNTDDPGSELHIIDDKDADNDAVLRLQSNGSNNDAIIEFYDGTSEAMSLHYDGGDEALYITDLMTTPDNKRLKIVRSTGSIIPQAHKVADLGTAMLAWNDIYYDDLHNMGAAAFTDRKVTKELLNYPPKPKPAGAFDEKTEKGLRELDPNSVPPALRDGYDLLTDEMTTYNYKANYEQQVIIEKQNKALAELKKENEQLKELLKKLEKRVSELEKN